MQSPHAISSIKTSNEGQHYSAQASYIWCWETRKYAIFLRDQLVNLRRGNPELGWCLKRHYHLVAQGKGQYATSWAAVGRSLHGGSLPLNDGSQSVPHKKNVTSKKTGEIHYSYDVENSPRPCSELLLYTVQDNSETWRCTCSCR